MVQMVHIDGSAPHKTSLASILPMFHCWINESAGATQLSFVLQLSDKSHSDQVTFSVTSWGILDDLFLRNRDRSERQGGWSPTDPAWVPRVVEKGTRGNFIIGHLSWWEQFHHFAYAPNSVRTSEK